MKNIQLNSENKYKQILLDNFLTLREKQIKFEENTQLSLTFWDVSNHKKFEIAFLELHTKLNEIKWFNFIGKTHFKNLFNIINKKIFLDLILSNFLISLCYTEIQSRDFLKEGLLFYLTDYLTLYKIEHQLDLNLTCAYVIEVLHLNAFFVNTPSCHFYDMPILNNLVDLKINNLIYFMPFNWPLIIPGKDYESVLIENNTFKNEYKGGYYSNLLDLSCGDKVKFKLVNSIIPTDSCLKLISKLQHTKFKLVSNIHTFKIIQLYFNFLSDTIDSLKFNRKPVNDYLENWYACFQYLTFIDSNIFEIYYPFQMDFRGRIYSAIKFGLNPTSNKLSRLILGFGKYFLTFEARTNYELYILTFLNKDLKKQNINTQYNSLNNFNFTDFENISEDTFYLLLKSYSIYTILLITDWYFNVLNYNTTEFNVELDASQSGFQMLALLANDKKAMQQTNLILVNNNVSSDLYTDFVNLLKLHITNENWCNFINRKLIKKVIMTIPYGSTFIGRMNMLLEVFKEEYIKNGIFNLDLLDYLLKSKILIGTTIITDNSKIKFEKFVKVNLNKQKYLEEIIKKLKKDLEFRLNKSIYSLDQIENIKLKYNKQISDREIQLKRLQELLNSKSLESEIELKRPIANLTLVEALEYVLTSYNIFKENEKLYFNRNITFDNINKNMDVFKLMKYLYSYILQDLQDNFFKELLIKLQLLVTIEYPKIQSLIQYLSKINKKIITTKYMKFFLTYFTLEEKLLTVGNTKYKKYITNKNIINLRKTNQAFIANLCHGFGDAFIIQDLIFNSSCNFYPIHDAILCQSIDVNVIKKDINKSYNFVYNYMHNYSDLANFYNQFIDDEVYVINSYDIFKIK